MSIETLFISVFNGISYALLLFLLSSGLTLVFGLMRVLNLAHSSFYMLGAYLGYAITRQFHDGFLIALFLVPIVLAALGWVVYLFLLCRLKDLATGQKHLAELLLTYGISLLILAVVQFVWGKSPVAYVFPQWLDGGLFDVGGVHFPRYRALIMVFAVFVLLILGYILRFQFFGVLLKAATQNPMMLEALGFPIKRFMAFIFAVGCALAGLAGVLGGIAYVTEPMMAQSIGMLLFVVIVIGGVGSLRGAFFASMLIGVFHSSMVTWNVQLAELFFIENNAVDSFWRLSTGQVAPLIPFLLMIFMLCLRPEGLCGKEIRWRR